MQSKEEKDKLVLNDCKEWQTVKGDGSEIISWVLHDLNLYTNKDFIAYWVISCINLYKFDVILLNLLEVKIKPFTVGIWKLYFFVPWYWFHIALMMCVYFICDILNFWWVPFALYICICIFIFLENLKVLVTFFLALWVRLLRISHLFCPRNTSSASTCL